MSMKVRIIAALVYVLVVLGSIAFYTSSARSADWRLYTEAGGMNVTEQGISEGHKSYHTLGVEGLWETTDWLNLKSGIYGFIRGEPAEEDPEIPCGGGGADVEAIFTSGFIDPYLGINYVHISRGTAPKYEDPSDPEYVAGYSQETEHDIVSARGGFHIQHGWFYADIGTIIPFYTNTKSGNFGADLGVGIKWNSWNLGYRFREYRFTDHHLEGGEALSFYFSGVQVGYTF